MRNESTLMRQTISSAALSVFMIFLFGISAASIQAATYTVTSTDGNGPGTLGYAMNLASLTIDHDTIVFNLASCPCTITTTGLTIITKGLTITGPGADMLTIYGSNQQMFLNFHSFLTIEGLTLSGGRAVPGYLTEGGGAVANFDGTTTLNNVKVTGNTGNKGGGIHNYLGTMNITNSTISGNAAQVNGGGVYLEGGTVTIINSVISQNGATGTGGGIHNESGHLNVYSSTISGNVSQSQGGGIQNGSFGQLRAEYCTLSGNLARWGGGIYNRSGGSVINTTISGNTAVQEGGGLGNGPSGSFNFDNSTVTGNHVQNGVGGGINALGFVGLYSTIVAGNFYDAGSASSDINLTIYHSDHSLIGDAATAGGLVNGVDGNIVGANPMLGPLRYNGGPTKTHALLLGSAAIDKGSNPGNFLNYDQRAFNRVFGTAVDIGSFETQPLCGGVDFGIAHNSAVGDVPRITTDGDFNGDGKADLATANLSNTISVLIGNGDGTFAAAVNYASGGNGTNSITTGDFNSDGKIDLVTTNFSSDNFSVFMGNGDGTFAGAVTYATGDNPNSIATGDFNGDGRTDLAVTNNSPFRISIRLGNGDGTFATAGSYPIGNTPGSVTAGDFNGDGNMDLATTNVTSDNLSVLLGNGDGTFAAAVNYLVGDAPVQTATGDFNGDGKTDLAAANTNSNNFSVLLGNGDGTFAPAINYAAGNRPTSIKTGDFNGDARADLAVANLNSDNISVRLGNGDGTFAAAVNSAVGDGPSSVTTGDFDGDGTTDLAVANGISDNVSVLLNGCSANMAPVATADSYSTDEDATLTAGSVLSNDSDGDGDALTAILVTYPVNASSFSLHADGTFSYNPNENYYGIDYFTYKANDGSLNSNVVMVTINVLPVDETPTISSGTIFRQQAAGSSNSSIGAVFDIDNPMGDLHVTVNGGASATLNGVTVSNISISVSGNVTANVSAACGASNATFELRVSDTEGRFSIATLNVDVTNETTPPVIDPISNVTVYLPLNSPASSRTVSFTLPNATDNCSTPVVTTSPVSGSVFSIGTTTVNVTGTDALNNTSTATFTVKVLYNFGGFLQPIDAMPALNIANAGSSIPVKFSLSGNKGLGILEVGYPISASLPCDQNEPGNEVEETDSAGNSVLTYDANSDQYKYVWQTNKSWKGTCRMLIVRLKDGSDHYAKFRFK